MRDYKVETKPSFWWVSLQHGAYSDWDIEYLYFRANSEEEVWDFLCRYYEDTETEKCWYPGLVWESANKKYLLHKYPKDNFDECLDWEYDYGKSKRVDIGRLNVITFRK